MEEQGLNIEDAKRKILDFLEEKLKEAHEKGDKVLAEIIKKEKDKIGEERLNIRDLLKRYEAPNILGTMRGLTVAGKPWNWDGVYCSTSVIPSEYKQDYNTTFDLVLARIKIYQFKDLIERLSEQNEGKPIRVLDLFGGAYFLTDLTDVSEIIGVRLEDIDEQLIEQIEKSIAESDNYKDIIRDSIIRKASKVMSLIKDPKRKVILGNLYDSKTWKILDAEKKEGFHLIVCRPQGPFTEKLGVYDPHQNIARIFSALLQRSMKLLAPNGIAFIQFPKITMDDFFWVKFMNDNKEFRFTFDTQDYRGSSCCAIKRLEKPLNQ